MQKVQLMQARVQIDGMAFPWLAAYGLILVGCYKGMQEWIRQWKLLQGLGVLGGSPGTEEVVISTFDFIPSFHSSNQPAQVVPSSFSSQPVKKE